MKVEFFPPREDIILVNSAPSEFYIVVNGSAVSWTSPGYDYVKLQERKTEISACIFRLFISYLLNVCINVLTQKGSLAIQSEDGDTYDMMLFPNSSLGIAKFSCGKLIGCLTWQ